LGWEAGFCRQLGERQETIGPRDLKNQTDPRDLTDLNEDLSFATVAETRDTLLVTVNHFILQLNSLLLIFASNVDKRAT